MYPNFRISINPNIHTCELNLKCKKVETETYILCPLLIFIELKMMMCMCNWLSQRFEKNAKMIVNNSLHHHCYTWIGCRCAACNIVKYRLR